MENDININLFNSWARYSTNNNDDDSQFQSNI